MKKKISVLTILVVAGLALTVWMAPSGSYLAAYQGEELPEVVRWFNTLPTDNLKNIIATDEVSTPSLLTRVLIAVAAKEAVEAEAGARVAEARAREAEARVKGGNSKLALTVTEIKEGDFDVVSF